MHFESPKNQLKCSLGAPSNILFRKKLLISHYLFLHILPSFESLGFYFTFPS
ncbi:hypothetical protein PORCAN_174 [Porphyromonas crevioricanis JCM 13913]|nr:hypothetical protein PORCAN_174 [Porphyromonas crevioricanis JCM 13913]